ncbi:DUF4265 domain-containing protein [Flavobacterium sp. XS2P12]|uniref:DUF4265 domain-containing protein n=1 Tax=Flavobacterium melibiosi TaxID=3398734 RepID=UPI003A89EB39
MKEKDDNVKILFRFFSNILDKWTVETLWATVINSEEGLYKLDNIPFYASVSCSDIVFAEFDKTENKLTYRETIEHSGNSTIQVILNDKSFIVNDLRDTFNSLGCDSEKFDDDYFVLEIPASLNYIPIRQKLIEYEERNILTYAEPNLSKNHWY